MCIQQADYIKNQCLLLGKLFPPPFDMNHPATSHLWNNEVRWKTPNFMATCKKVFDVASEARLIHHSYVHDDHACIV
jgi:hypothetical protein